MSAVSRKYTALMDGSAEPWELERVWHNGTIAPSRSGALFGAIFGVVWLVLVTGLVITFVVTFDDPILGLFAVVFIGPGIYMLVRFVPRLFHERWYRGVHLKPATVPVQPGERFQAVLYSGADGERYAAGNVQFDVRLTCNKMIERSTTNDRGRRYTRKILWEDSVPVAASMGSDGSRSVLTAHIAQDLPADMPETTRRPTERNKIDWRLEVDGRPGLPGFQYSFKLPVYDTRSARERADEALSSVTAQPNTGSSDTGSSVGSVDAPVAQGDLDGLRSYRDSVWDTRREQDPRPLLTRLGRATEPATYLARDEDRALSCIHVRGDRPARRLRRGLALLLIVLVIAIPPLPTTALLLGALVLAIMAKAARPVAIAVHADSDGLHIDSVDGFRRRSGDYGWEQIGMITDVAFTNRYRDILVPRPKRGRNGGRGPGGKALGMRISSNQYAEGLAAAIAAVRNRYRG
ncbi:MAG: hypothetical protein R6U25_08475 [Alkalispirochaeta sp.]